jgi:prepilin-type N-terminal cleavage/methylation domain-containing protein
MVTRGPAPGPRAGFTLVEALVALVLLAFGALAAASAQGWAARTLEAADRREAATTLAERVLDSLALCPVVSDGSLQDGHGLTVAWIAEPAGRATRVRLQVRGGPGAAGDPESFGALLGPPPPLLEADP